MTVFSLCQSLGRKHNLLSQPFLVKKDFFFPLTSQGLFIHFTPQMFLTGWTSLPPLQRGDFLNFASALAKGFKEVKEPGHTTAVNVRDWTIKEDNVKFEQCEYSGKNLPF